ncbi:MAG: bifunctional oligoribonuclease/PAP phosphatase NrnA, partial [Fimbriimonas ginsengisoli]|nr:bifunctional oligoribonuclease/PAP phosphatase NrnA [Fimbriimonas ginsengisoli]
TVQIAALFRGSRPGKVRTSLRSRHAFDVAEVAREFGGGGHANAAGCTFEEPIHQAAERVVARLKICLESS